MKAAFHECRVSNDGLDNRLNWLRDSAFLSSKGDLFHKTAERSPYSQSLSDSDTPDEQIKPGG